MMSTSPFLSSIENVVECLPAPRRIEMCNSVRACDCVIAIAGFEDRCVSAVSEMRTLGWKSVHAICVRYTNSDMDAPNSKFFDRTVNEMRALTDGRDPDLLSHDDHIVEVDFGSHLLERLTAHGLDLSSKKTHIVFDITVGSSRLLLEGLHALFRTDATITLLYTEVERYRPTFDEYRQYLSEQRMRNIEPPEFLTQGVDRVEVLKSIPGMNADSRPSYLVVFPAFAFTRVSAVIEELSPSRVQWIFGIPHLVQNRWRIDAQRAYHETLIESAHRHCFVSTFDYRETLIVLDRIYVKRRSSYGMFVASLGSKMQKVGQVLFHLMRPEAAAVVSIPRVWNDERYSDVSSTTVFSLELGDCGTLRNILWSTRTLRT